MNNLPFIQRNIKTVFIFALLSSSSMAFAQKGFSQFYQCYSSIVGLPESSGDYLDTKEDYYVALVHSSSKGLSPHLMIEAGYDNFIIFNSKGAKLIVSEESERVKSFLGEVERRTPIRISPVGENKSIDIYYVNVKNENLKGYATEGFLHKDAYEIIKKEIKKINVLMIKKESLLPLNISIDLLSSTMLGHARYNNEMWASGQIKQNLDVSLRTKTIYINGQIYSEMSSFIIPERLNLKIQTIKNSIKRLGNCANFLDHKKINDAVSLEKENLQQQLSYLHRVELDPEATLEDMILDDMMNDDVMNEILEHLLNDPEFMKKLERLYEGLEKENSKPKRRQKKKRQTRRM